MLINVSMAAQAGIPVKRVSSNIYTGRNRMDTNTKILPITMPPITAYQRNTSMLAILHHDEDTHDWIYNNFIQIKMSMDDFNKNRAMDYHLNYLFEGMHAFCPWIY